MMKTILLIVGLLSVSMCNPYRRGGGSSSIGGGGSYGGRPGSYGGRPGSYSNDQVTKRWGVSEK